MASPFTAAERCKLLQIAGIPPGIGGVSQNVNVNALILYPFSNTDLWRTNFFSTGDLSPILAALDGVLNTYTDTVTADAVREAFPDWDNFKFSEIKISKSSATSEGIIVDAELKRREIRRYIFNLVGFFVPEYGYLHEMEAVLGKSIKDFRKNQGGR